MKYKGAARPLGADNLLYLTQALTDENGIFTLSYTPDEDYATPTDFGAALSYTGAAQYLNPLLLYNGQRLVEGTDYRLTGAFRADAVGEYRFTVTGIGAFTGSRTLVCTVEKKDCKTLDVDEIGPLAYGGSALEPKLTVRNGEVVLTEGTDYTVTYQNSNGAGIGIAVITGRGNYEGRQVCLFDIAPCALTEEMLLAIPDQTYTGEPVEPRQLLKGLAYGADYTAEYTENIEVGTASVTLAGIGSYTGTLTAQFAIIPKPEPTPKDPDASGKDPENPDTPGKDPENPDDPGKDPENPDNPGGGTENPSNPGGDTENPGSPGGDTGKPTNPGGGTQTPTKPGDTGTTPGGQVSGGTAQKPSNPGGSGQSGASVKKPKKATLSSLKPLTGRKLKITWKKSKDADGCEIWYSLKKNFKSGVKKKTVKKAKQTSLTLTKLKKGKQYYVKIRAYKTVRVKGKKKNQAGAWSKTLKSKKIRK